MNLYKPDTNPETNLVWIDCEFTGLSAEKDKILEIAILITNSKLEVIEELPAITIYQPKEILDNMSAVVTEMHTENGLLERVKNSKITENQADIIAYEFVCKHSTENKSPMCGNTIYKDRSFIAKHMPKLNAYLHYHLLDVTALKELYRIWFPTKPVFQKKEVHEAMEDIHESIQELLFYKKNMFNTDLN